MGLSSAGIGSGLDVTGIIQQLMTAEKKPLDSLNTKKTDYQAKLTAFGAIKNNLSQFQTSLQNLSDVSKIQAVTATASDANVLSASGSASANPGNYNVEIQQLAQAQKLATTGQANLNTIIGSGTLSFDFGTITGTANNNGKYTGASFVNNGLSTKTVIIDASNNTLSGIRNAINAANIGVTASIINDGSNTPYRLALSNSQTGESQSMKISTSADSDSALSALLSHDPANDNGQALTETLKAQNAKLTVDGINVSKTNNTINDVIPGVTLNLKKTNLATPITLNVVRDTQGLSTNLQQFVDTYNKLSGSLKSMSSYDLATKKGAVLYGDSSLRSMQSQMRSILSATLPEATGKLTKLNQLGIAFQKDGTLSLDKTKLQGVIDANFSQISPLFAATGNSSDSLISYASATNKTKTGSYGVTVSQLASQGSWVGGASAGLEIKSGINDTLQVTLDGLSASITLPTGTYANAGALATDLQARINGNSTFSTAGSAATVTADSNGIISMTSGRYGSSSTISLSGNAVTDLLGGNGTAQAGLALVGTINSKNAITSGQTLTGIVGDDSEGLKIKIIGGTSGNRGIINYTQGFAYQLNQLGSSFVGDNGLILARTDGITGSMKKLDNDILRMQDRLTTLQKHYQTQFSALDTTMTKMNSTTSFLTQQLTALAKSA
jgi:flagellar hook-associated protein 2